MRGRLRSRIATYGRTTTANPRPQRTTMICPHPGLDRADAAECDRIYDLAAFDHRLNMVTRPLNRDGYQQLRDTMEHGAPQVRISSIIFFTTTTAHEIFPFALHAALLL